MHFEVNELKDLDYFSELDIQFAEFITKISGVDNPYVEIAALLISNRTSRGDICIDIPTIAGKYYSDAFGESEEIEDKIIFPNKDEWISKLKDSSLIGRPYDYKPLILDEKNRLFLYRYWDYEQTIANNINERLNNKPDDINSSILKKALDRLFPNIENNETDWQRITALTAVLNRFCIISGGPGTGKTSTIVKIIALLIEQGIAKGFIPKIALCSPTGKAAARIRESIKRAKEENSINCTNIIKNAIPEETYTIHRLLGPIPGSPYFHYNRENNLPYDIVIIDESSMGDLALMSKLFESVPLKSHLILLGDKDQLASVEAGAVFGDICDTGNEHNYSKKFITKVQDISGDVVSSVNKITEEPPIADSLMILRKSYRFGSDSGIGAVSHEVRRGNCNEAIRLLKEDCFDDIKLVEDISKNNFSNELSYHILKGYKKYLKAESPEIAMNLFSEFTILCAIRQGPYGVAMINKIVEKILMENDLITLKERWYKGRPIMVTRNDYNLELFNGDMGIIYPDPSSDDALRCFLSSHEGRLKKFHPLKLPEHETVYAMTVHKSQGSEFNKVLLILPDRISQVLSRELLYTAITRARNKVEIWGKEEILRIMISRPTTRKSGLRDALWS